MLGVHKMMLTSYVTLLQLSNYQQVKNLNASAKKRSMIYTLLIVLRKSSLYCYLQFVVVVWWWYRFDYYFIVSNYIYNFVNSPNL